MSCPGEALEVRVLGKKSLESSSSSSKVTKAVLHNLLFFVRIYDLGDQRRHILLPGLTVTISVLRIKGACQEGNYPLSTPEILTSCESGILMCQSLISAMVP